MIEAIKGSSWFQKEFTSINPLELILEKLEHGNGLFLHRSGEFWIESLMRTRLSEIWRNYYDKPNDMEKGITESWIYYAIRLLYKRVESKKYQETGKFLETPGLTSFLLRKHLDMLIKFRLSFSFFRLRRRQ